MPLLIHEGGILKPVKRRFEHHEGILKPVKRDLIYDAPQYPAVGQPWQGNRYGGLVLGVPTLVGNQLPNMVWSEVAQFFDTTSTTDGAANTSQVSALSGYFGFETAARACVEYNDPSGLGWWFLPARDQLRDLLANLRPTMPDVPPTTMFWSSTMPAPGVLLAVGVTLEGAYTDLPWDWPAAVLPIRTAPALPPGTWKEFFVGEPPAQPFSLSGTFAADGDGWTFVGMSWSSSSTNARTPPGSLATNTSANYALYNVPANVARGCHITASVWVRRSGTSNVGASMEYSVDGGATFNPLASVTGVGTAYTELVGSFDNPGDDLVVLRMTGQDGFSRTTCFDDWSITGTPL